MERKLTVTIEVDAETREITIRDDTGNERRLRSAIVFGGDADAGEFYLFAWGGSADAAWAFKQGLLHAEESGDPAYRSFYRQCACHIVQAASPDAFGPPEADAGEILENWQAGDRRKSTLH